MRSLSPVMAITLLIIISISVISASYIWISNYQKRLLKSAEEETKIYSKPYFSIRVLYEGCGDWKQWNRHCYKKFEVKKNFAEAFKECLKYNSHLITIHSVDEFLFVKNVVIGQENIIGPPYYWLGLIQNNSIENPPSPSNDTKDYKRREGWYWITREPYNFCLWSCSYDCFGGGQPDFCCPAKDENGDGYLEDQDCADIWWVDCENFDFNDSWDNIGCNLNLYFVCEKLPITIIISNLGDVPIDLNKTAVLFYKDDNFLCSVKLNEKYRLADADQLTEELEFTFIKCDKDILKPNDYATCHIIGLPCEYVILKYSNIKVCIIYRGTRMCSNLYL